MIYNLKKLKKVYQSKQRPAEYPGIAISPDGNFVRLSNLDEATLYDIQQAKEIYQSNNDSLFYNPFSTDSKYTLFSREIRKNNAPYTEYTIFDNTTQTKACTIDFDIPDFFHSSTDFIDNQYLVLNGHKKGYIQESQMWICKIHEGNIIPIDTMPGEYNRQVVYPDKRHLITINNRQEQIIVRDMKRKKNVCCMLGYAKQNVYLENIIVSIDYKKLGLVYKHKGTRKRLLEIYQVPCNLYLIAKKHSHYAKREAKLASQDEAERREYILTEHKNLYGKTRKENKKYKKNYITMHAGKKTATVPKLLLL